MKSYKTVFYIYINNINNCSCSDRTVGHILLSTRLSFAGEALKTALINKSKTIVIAGILLVGSIIKQSSM